jgi:hypothetical protein
MARPSGLLAPVCLPDAISHQCDAKGYGPFVHDDLPCLIRRTLADHVETIQIALKWR